MLFSLRFLCVCDLKVIYSTTEAQRTRRKEKLLPQNFTQLERATLAFIGLGIDPQLFEIHSLED